MAKHDQSVPRFNPSNELMTPDDLIHLYTRYVPIGERQEFAPRNMATYHLALTHRSYSLGRAGVAALARMNHEAPCGCVPLQPACNERMEFVGDAVLGLAVASYLHARYPNEGEGFLTRMRTRLVNGVTLARLCAECGLCKYVLVSAQVEASGGRADRHVLEDAFEAFLAALHLDAGYDSAAAWVVGVMEAHLDFAGLVIDHGCPKDALNRHCQRTMGCLPEFSELLGGDCAVFNACVRVRRGGPVLGTGRGQSLREAEADAARMALNMLGVGRG